MRIYAFFLCLLLSHVAFAADWVVIVHPNSGVEKLSKNEVVNIFMGRYRKFPSGKNAVPLDIISPPADREQFYKFLLNKELADVDAYWARLKFSGQVAPPTPVDDVDAILYLVANHVGYIAYCDKKKINSKVKVVLDLSI
ncbi:MAG: hypothetical protein RL571_786 [Pseudomonadota bacterium]|jgi:hypothetical protein